MTDRATNGLVSSYVLLFRRLILIELAIYWLPLVTGGAVILSYVGFWPGVLVLVGAPAYRIFKLAGLGLMVLGVILGTPFWVVAVIAAFAIGYGELLRHYFLPRQRAILEAQRSKAKQPDASASSELSTMIKVDSAVAAVLGHAIQARLVGRPLDTQTVLVALMRVKVDAQWSRIWLHSRNTEALSRTAMPDPDATIGGMWQGVEVTSTLAHALRVAARLAREYTMEPVGVGILTLALVADPRSGAARSLGVGDGITHQALVGLVQEELIGGKLADLDLS